LTLLPSPLLLLLKEPPSLVLHQQQEQQLILLYLPLLSFDSYFFLHSLHIYSPHFHDPRGHASLPKSKQGLEHLEPPTPTLTADEEGDVVALLGREGGRARWKRRRRRRRRNGRWWELLVGRMRKRFGL